MSFGDVAGLAEGLGDALRVAVGVGRPVVGAGGRVDAHHAVGADAEFAQLAADAARLFHLLDERLRSSALPIAEPPPVGGQTGATSEPTARPRVRDLVGEPPDVVSTWNRCSCAGRSGTGRRRRTALRRPRLRREVEHRVEVDRRLGVGSLADQSRPHRVVEFGVSVGHDSSNIIHLEKRPGEPAGAGIGFVLQIGVWTF